MAYRIHGIGTDVHGDVCISVIDDAGAPVLLVTSPVYDDRSAEEAEKLARVAAAGFDMLEALREIADHAEDPEDDPHAWHCQSRVKDVALAAIAKAEGKK